jgi:hypothetical protein
MKTLQTGAFRLLPPPDQLWRVRPRRFASNDLFSNVSRIQREGSLHFNVLVTSTVSSHAIVTTLLLCAHTHSLSLLCSLSPQCVSWRVCLSAGFWGWWLLPWRRYASVVALPSSRPRTTATLRSASALAPWRPHHRRHHRRSAPAMTLRLRC